MFQFSNNVSVDLKDSYSYERSDIDHLLMYSCVVYNYYTLKFLSNML